MNKLLRTAIFLSASAACFISCTNSTSAEPGATRTANIKNPLIGSWKFDTTSSVVHNAVYAANAGLNDKQQAQTKKFIQLMEGSTVTFTADTITTTSGSDVQSMNYTVKSSDENGNIVIVDKSGAPATYSVSGNSLSNTVPAYHFVAVYKKQ
ncbi:MAG: hypothetical protein H8M99_02380 [Gloeobacteraceae cyanobacterium ES-bin-144]|nr:hypothetical protein [Verrucomicrobiales bacterium]